MRCLVLADALAAAGWDCAFACNAEAGETVPGVRRYDLLESIDGRWDLAVVDHYGLDAEYEGGLRGKARSILVIDDIHDRRHDCDLLLDQTLGRMADDYAGLLPEGCRMLLGPAHALLRPEFAEHRKRSLARRRGAVECILLGFGATDPHNLTALAMRELADWGAAINVVLGKGAPHLEQVRALAGGSFTLHVNPPAMAGLMAAADLAIGTPGITSWERCTLGLPAILIAIADNQRQIAAELHKIGAVVDLGGHETLNADEISHTVEALCGDSAALTHMAEAAASVCDGQGTDRVVVALSEIM